MLFPSHDTPHSQQPSQTQTCQSSLQSQFDLNQPQHTNQHIHTNGKISTSQNHLQHHSLRQNSILMSQEQRHHTQQHSQSQQHSQIQSKHDQIDNGSTLQSQVTSIPQLPQISSATLDFDPNSLLSPQPIFQLRTNQPQGKLNNRKKLHLDSDIENDINDGVKK